MTEYTVLEEISISVVLTGSELLGISQAGVFKKAAITDVILMPLQSSQTYAGTNTFNGAVTFNGLVDFTNSGFSTLVATTKSGKVGFYGHAGTSQRSGGVQVTMTLSSFSGTTNTNLGFTSTAQASLLFGQVQEIQQTLLDMGVWKGS